MSLLDKALARLERAVTRLEAACPGAGGKEAASHPGGPRDEAERSPLQQAARGDAAAGAIAGEEIGVEEKGGE